MPDIEYSQGRAAAADAQWTPQARRERVARAAIENVYGPMAGAPEVWGQAQAAQTGQNNAEAQQQLGLVTSLQKVRDSGGDVSAAYDQLKPVIAQHVDPQHMAGLEQLIKSDPSKLDAVHEGILQSNPQLAKIGQGQQKIDISLGGLQEKTQYHHGLLDIGQQKADTGQQRADQSFQLGQERNDIAKQRVSLATRNAAAPLDDDTLGFLYERDKAGDNSLMGRMSAANKAQYAGFAAKRAADEGDTGQAFVYQRQAAKARATAVNDLGKSGLSTSGGIVRANSAALEHMNQLDGLVDALGNGDNQGVNRITNAITAWSGGTAPTNIKDVGRLAGQEITKAIIANGGSKGEREEAAASFSDIRSTPQLKGALENYRGLLSGQMKSLRQKYIGLNATNEFDAQLTPTAKANMGLTGTQADESQSIGGNAPPAQAAPATAQPAAPQKATNDFSHLW